MKVQEGKIENDDQISGKILKRLIYFREIMSAEESNKIVSR